MRLLPFAAAADKVMLLRTSEEVAESGYQLGKPCQDSRCDDACGFGFYQSYREYEEDQRDNNATHPGPCVRAFPRHRNDDEDAYGEEYPHVLIFSEMQDYFNGSVCGA